MKGRRKLLIWAAVMACITALVACRNPLVSGETGTATPSAGATGRISISIARVAPAVAAALEERAAAVAASRSLAVPRAYLGADRLHITLKQNAALVSEWDHPVVQEVYEDVVAASIAEPQYPSTTFSETVAVGSGYTLEAKVYNNATDETAPVVEGVSSSFAVTAENTDENPCQVDVVCLPSTPILLEVGTPSEETELLNLWDLTAATGTIVIGSEIWYRVEVPAALYHEFSVIPSSGSKAYPAAFIFSGAGSPQAAELSTAPGEPATTRLATDAGTYFIGVIDELNEDQGTDRHFTVAVSGPDPLSGPWTLSTTGELSIAEANIGENILFNWEDNTWESVGAEDGVAFTRSGTWSPGDEDGTYTLSFESGAPSDVTSADLTLSEDGPTLTRTMGDATDVFVPESIVLPPTELTAAVESGEEPAVQLSWTSSASSEVTGYRVYRRLADEGEWSSIATITDASANVFTDTNEMAGDGLEWNLSYDYKVAALAGEEESPITSNVATVAVEGGAVRVYVY